MEELFTRLAAFLAYVAGFAAIPFMAKRFTGLLGQLTGQVNDRSKGLIDRSSNAVKNFTKKRREGRKAAKRAKLMEDANQTEGLQSVNPLKRSTYRDAWKNRQRIRAQTMQGWDRFKAGGNFVRPKDFLKEGAGDAQQQIEKDKAKQEKRNERVALGLPPTTAFERRRQHRQRISTLASQKVGEEVVEAGKRALAGAEMATYGKTFDQLESMTLDSSGNIYERQVALSKLVKSGQVKKVRTVMAEAYNRQTVDENDDLVKIFKNLKNSNELYDGLKDKAPDIAKSAFDEDEVTGKVTLKAAPDFQFLEEDSIEGSTQWDVSTWDRALEADPAIRDKIFNKLGKGILQSEQMRRKTNQKTIGRLEAYGGHKSPSQEFIKPLDAYIERSKANQKAREALEASSENQEDKDEDTETK